MLNDWSFSIPQIEFDDAISHMRILQDNNERVGLVITDYQPHITTKLSRLSFTPDAFYSVFDYLQGIDGISGHVIDYRDLSWPKGAYFDFTNFRIFVMLHQQHYATIVFDIQGKILWIDYLAGPLAGSRMLFDSRGFISRQESKEEETYFSPAGTWRFKHNKQTGKVKINPLAPKFCQQMQYQNLNDLVNEVVATSFLTKVQADDLLIVTADDQSRVSMATYAQAPRIIYSVSHWHPYDQTLGKLHAAHIIADTKQRCQEVRSTVAANHCRIDFLPLFQSQFKLGHSQRLAQQRLGVFAENMSSAEFAEALATIYPRLLKKPKDEALYIFTYSPAKDAMVHQVFDEFRKEHQGEFILSIDEVDPGENKLEENMLPPLLTIKMQRLVSSMEVLTALDKIRLLLVWGQADQFLTIASVSVGIPLLQNFETEEVTDHKNGIICHNFADVSAGIAYYFDTLKHWNESLVYNVQMLNAYSETRLFAKWRAIIAEGGN